jgi:hypothetical protein
MVDDATLESDADASVGLPATGEPLVLAPVLEVEEIPLPEELRAPVPPSPIWAPSPPLWPFEAAVVTEYVRLGIVDPSWIGLDMADMEDFSMEDVVQLHPGRISSPEISNTIFYLSEENIHSWKLGPDEGSHLDVIQDIVKDLQADKSLPWQNKNEYANWREAGGGHLVSSHKGAPIEMDSGRYGKYDQIKHNEGITNDVPIAPPPHPAPEKLMEEDPVDGVASRGEGSGFIALEARDADNADPPAHQRVRIFGISQRDYCLNDPIITASWAQMSQADDPPVPVQESASYSRILGESVRGSRSGGASSRAWLNSLGGRKAFISLSMKEIRNIRKLLERDAKAQRARGRAGVPGLIPHHREDLGLRDLAEEDVGYVAVLSWGTHGY